MDKDTFTDLIATYGSAPAHWPRDRRAAMQAAMETLPQARAIVSREAALDGLLSARLPDAPEDLEARIMVQMRQTISPPAPKNVSTPHTSPDTSPHTLQKKNILARLLRPYELSVATALAASCFAGVLSAPMLADILNPPIIAIAGDALGAPFDVIVGDILATN